jgi:Domain of unknown function (DUF4145)
MDTMKAHCNVCGGARNSAILYSHAEPWEVEVGHNVTMNGTETYWLLKCLGCDTVRLRHDDYNADVDDTTTRYYPPAQARRKPKWLINLRRAFKDDEREIVATYLDEIYRAIYADSRRLAAIGIRSLLEHVMIKRAGDQGSFKRNVDAFLNAGYLSTQQAKFLEDTLEAGHASTHRAWKPTTDELNTLLDVSEAIIETVYVLKDKLKAIKVPPRPPRP